MPKENDLLDKAKISAAAALVIIVTIIGALVWFFDRIPQKSDVEDAEAKSMRIINWVKELDQGTKSNAISLEARLHGEFIRGLDHLDKRLDTIEDVQRDILSRMPRKVAEK